MRIRDEMPADWPDVDRLNRLVFGGEVEAELVKRLRDARLIACALVAESADAIVGHIAFSWLAACVDGRVVKAAALAPLAVHPNCQRQGIGSRLVVAGLARAHAAGASAIIVLGHPAYYRRFGFSASLAAKLQAPFAGAAFMALELTPGALAGSSGSVSYPPAFGVAAGKK
jgi:putative acetyltransferase